MGKGSGASIRGQVLTRIEPAAFRTLLKGRRIAAVTGTNGKTTSTHLLAAALRTALGADSGRVVTNADGANLHYGIASALAKARHADVAVLETDERVVADLIAHGDPEVLVLLNFSRDQLDRNHEIKFLGRAWRQALEKAGADGWLAGPELRYDGPLNNVRNNLLNNLFRAVSVPTLKDAVKSLPGAAKKVPEGAADVLDKVLDLSGVGL